MTSTKNTLEKWFKALGAGVSPIMTHAPCVGIHDTRAIEKVRTYLWDLCDYYVSSVAAGVIWLLPRKQFTITYRDTRGRLKFRVLHALSVDGAKEQIGHESPNATILTVRENNPPLETITAVTRNEKRS